MAAPPQSTLDPYVARLVRDWEVGTTARELDGSLVSVDLSGFTALSERLAAQGRAGAEELVFLISSVFDGLIGAAAQRGGDVLKFRGDALLILFDGPRHEQRACTAAVEMQSVIAQSGRADSSVGHVALSMATGVFSGPCQFFLAGTSHHELIVAGPAATATIRLEDAAQAGEILVSPATAAALGKGWVDRERDGAFLLLDDFAGHAAAVATVSDAPPRADLEQFVPEPLREALGGGSGEAEHRQAATAFVKFSGVGALLAAEGLEGLDERIDAFAQAVGEAADDNGVTWLESDIDVDGGKAYLIAGIPTSGGFDEARMLRTVHRILASDCGLTLRAGINRGRVFAGEIGARTRHTYAVLGDTVNLAARLTGRAQPGQILSTGAVLDRSEVLFESEAQPFLVKGKERAVTAYSVGALIGRREEQAPLPLPLIGRDAELELALAAVNAARLRQQRLVEVVGEAGIGKSRLLEELVGQAVGFAQFLARCESHATAAPYFVFRPILRQLAGILPGASSEEAGAQLGALGPGGHAGPGAVAAAPRRTVRRDGAGHAGGRRNRPGVPAQARARGRRAVPEPRAAHADAVRRRGHALAGRRLPRTARRVARRAGDAAVARVHDPAAGRRGTGTGGSRGPRRAGAGAARRRCDGAACARSGRGADPRRRGRLGRCCAFGREPALRPGARHGGERGDQRAAGNGRDG